MREGLFVQRAEPFDRCVGVGGRLKIGKISLAIVVSLAHARDALVDLAQDVGPGQSSAGTEAAIVAKRAAAFGHGAVDIGASEASVNTYLLDALPKTLPENEV